MLIEVFGEIINPEKVLYIENTKGINAERKDAPCCKIVFKSPSYEHSDHGYITIFKSKQEVMNEINSKWK